MNWRIKLFGLPIHSQPRVKEETTVQDEDRVMSSSVIEDVISEIAQKVSRAHL